MKKEEIKKLSEVIKRLIKNEVNLAVQDIGKVMGKVIKEQVANEFKKQKSIINEYDVVKQKQNARNSNLRESFNKQINYGYTLAKALDNNNKVDIDKYTPTDLKGDTIKTSNTILANVLKDVEENMPENFNNTSFYNTSNLNESLYNVQSNQLNLGGQKSNTFELPSQDTEGGLLHLESVNPNVINSLIKDYRPIIKKIEEKKPIAKQTLNYEDLNFDQINKTVNNN